MGDLDGQFLKQSSTFWIYVFLDKNHNFSGRKSQLFAQPQKLASWALASASEKI
jgi:hypothetical protein